MDLPGLGVLLADTMNSDALATLNHIIIVIKRTISVLGSSIILIGALYAICRFLIKIGTTPTKNTNLNLDMVRLDLGRTIILGLEFIIAADVIETTTTPDYYSLGILAVLVVIRTFLNYSLNHDLTALSQQDHDQLT